MYVIYKKNKGFLIEKNGIVKDDYDYKLDEYTVTFGDLENAKDHCELGEVVLKVEFHTVA